MSTSIADAATRTTGEHEHALRRWSRAPLLRFDSLRWFTGPYFLVLGASLLLLPPATIGRTIAGQPLRGALLALAGLALLWAVWGGLRRQHAALLQVIAAVPCLWVAADYALQGAISGATLLTLIGAGLLLAARVPPGQIERRPDALGLALGASEAALGLDMTINPAIYEAVLSAFRLPPAGMGVALILGGAAVVLVQLLQGLPGAARWAAHLFAGGGMLLYWLATAVLDPLYWALGASVVMRGVAVATLPSWSEKVARYDSRSIRAQLMVALATASLLPLLLALPVILSEEQRLIGDDPANVRKISFAVALLLGSAAVLMGGWLAARLTRSLENLAVGAGKIAGSEIPAALPIDGPTEVVQLGQAIEAMAASLARRASEREALLRGEQVAREEADLERLRLQQLLDRLPEGVMVSDAEGRTIYLNQVAVELLGFDTTAMASSRVESGLFRRFEVRRPDGSVYVTDELPLRRALSRGEDVLREREIIRNPANGRDVPILVNASPIRDRAGAIVGGVAVFQDMSAMEAFEKARDAFFASVSHDLQNPLAGIRGSLQLILLQLTRGRMDPAAVEARLTPLLAITDRMSAMLDELIDLTQLRAGQPLPLRLRQVDLVPLVRACVEAGQRTTDKHRIVFEPAVQTLGGSWDGARLSRAVDNLIGNAIKYSPDGGSIVVELTRDGDEAILVVRDEGDGIAGHELHEIFEPYKRGGEVIGRIHGYGLGLAGVRQIVEQHGGMVGASSDGPGRGANFTVRLPLLARTPAFPSPDGKGPS